MINEEQAQAAYLAAVFDMGMGVQLAPNGKFGHRIRMNKTSRSQFLPFVLYDYVGAGSIFPTSAGYRWCLENQNKIRELLERIEPFVNVRRKELEILLDLCAVNPKQSAEALLEEWQKTHS